MCMKSLTKITLQGISKSNGGPQVSQYQTAVLSSFNNTNDAENCVIAN